MTSTLKAYHTQAVQTMVLRILEYSNLILNVATSWSSKDYKLAEFE